MGWFFGFKLHLICNEKGEVLNFMITLSDVEYRNTSMTHLWHNMLKNISLSITIAALMAIGREWQDISFLNI